VTAVQQLTTPAELQRAEAAFRNAFAKASYTDPFSEALPARLLLYPIDYTLLDAEQVEAVARAARRYGNNPAYFAGFGGEERGWGGTYGHCLVDLGSFDDYRGANKVGNLEHFLFGMSGEWAAVTSDGEYALVAGDEPFVREVAAALDYDQDQVLRSFISDWREAGGAGASVQWVPALLDHILGEGEGSRAWAARR
jgi:hypothetical protein